MVISPKYRAWIVGAAIAAATVVFQTLADFDPTTIVDWQAWAIGIGAAVVRQVAVFMTGKLAGG